MMTKRPGSRPWASFCFHYRGQQSSHPALPMRYLPSLASPWSASPVPTFKLPAPVSRSSSAAGPTATRAIQRAPATLGLGQLVPTAPKSGQLVHVAPSPGPSARPLSALASNKRGRSPSVDPRKRARTTATEWNDITDEEYTARLTCHGGELHPSIPTTSEQVDLLILETLRQQLEMTHSPKSPPAQQHARSVERES